MTYLYTNNAESTLASGISDSATSISVASGEGALFPTPAGGNVFLATLVRASDDAIEIVEVTARSTDTLTVVRAREGTTGLTCLAGDKVELRLTAGQLTGLVTNATHTGDATGSGALTVVGLNGTALSGLATGLLKNTTTTGVPSIAVAGTDYVTPTGAETLSAKTLTAPVVTNYTETVYAPSAGSAWTVSLANGTVQKLTTNANATITLPSSVAGKSYLIIVAYGGTHTITWAGGSTIKWSGGTAPTATSVNGKFDIFAFTCDGTNTYGRSGGSNF